VKERLRIAFVIFFGLTVLIVLTAWVTNKLWTNYCHNHVVKETFSHDKRFKAVVFERSCGATTASSTQVSILAGNEKLPDSPGTVFRVDTDQGKASAAPHGGPEVRTNWIADRLLRVSYHQNARVFHADKEIRGVAIEYTVFDELIN
jgi:hypothetical protein